MLNFSGRWIDKRWAWKGGNKMKKLSIFMTLVTFVAFLAGGSIATADILEVNNTISCSDITGTPYCTIQAAVNAASADDIILVHPGTYNESVIVNKTVTIKAAPGYDIRPYVNGGNNSAFYITGVGATVEGFEAHGNWWDIIAVKADDVVVRNNLVTGPGPSTSWMIPNPGPGISVIEVQNVQVIRNHVHNTTGTGIWMGAARYCIIQDNKISDTQYTGILLAPWGGQRDGLVSVLGTQLMEIR